MPYLAEEGLAISQGEIVAVLQAFKKLEESGVKLIYPGHSHYPPNFLLINEPPFLLSYRGEPVWLKAQGIGVVGSREPTNMSKKWMELHLSQLIEKLPLFTVSGGARGVDQLTHSLSILKGRATVVIIPAGLGQLYPESLALLVEPILKNGGAILSEYDFMQPMRKHFFHARNRLIAALSELTLIVQASSKSGTLITCRQAIEQGKPLLIVPSHPLDVEHRGGLDLLSEGATLVKDAQDLIEIIKIELKQF